MSAIQDLTRQATSHLAEAESITTAVLKHGGPTTDEMLRRATHFTNMSVANSLLALVHMYNLPSGGPV